MGSSDLIEANDVRVSQHLHDLDLPEDLLQVLIIKLGLVHNFYRHLFFFPQSKTARKRGEIIYREGEREMERKNGEMEGDRGRDGEKRRTI